jgi:DNA-binding CsgD family transcriptional regulator
VRTEDSIDIAVVPDLDALARAADEMRRAHEFGGALRLYEDALGASMARGERDALVRIVEGAALAARHDPDPGAALPLIDRALTAQPLLPAQRGRLLFARGLVLGYTGALDERVTCLQQARAAFEEAADDPRLARTLGALAIPLGAGIGLPERIALGERGCVAARRAGDVNAGAHCEGNLAGALAASGDVRAFGRWRRAVGLLENDPDPGARDDAIRYRSQWVGAALHWGRYDEARALIADARARTTHPFWLRRFAMHEAMLAWRTGRWDEALTAAGVAIEGQPPHRMSAARVIVAAIALERAPRGSVPIVEVNGADALNPGAFTLALAIELRLRRREPSSARGAADVIDTAARMGLRTGWEDLLPVCAEADPRAAARMLEISDLLVAPRGMPSKLLAEAILAEPTDATTAGERARAAAAGFEQLGEPFNRARALELAARATVRAGGRAGDERRLAAELYDSIGAERSLARLIRASGRSRALERYAVPRSQRYAASPGLTVREREVARLAAEAYTAREIAQQLGLSVATVQTHLRRIKVVVGAARKSDLVRLLRDV